MEPFYIRFTFSDPARFEAAEKAFARLQECKAKDEWPEELEAWRPYFDSRALAHFVWPTPRSRSARSGFTFCLLLKKWGSQPEVEPPWDFLSMIDAFRNGDYQLEGLEPIGETSGRLTFEPFGWPYGGCGCMKAFLRAFEMTITEERC